MIVNMLSPRGDLKRRMKRWLPKHLVFVNHHCNSPMEASLILMSFDTLHMLMILNRPSSTYMMTPITDRYDCHCSLCGVLCYERQLLVKETGEIEMLSPMWA